MKKKSKVEQYSAQFKSSVATSVKPDAISVGNTDAVNFLCKDMEAVEFVNEVLLGEDHKTDDYSGNIVLTEEWAKSYAKAVNEKPGFLYIRGHADAANWAMRAIADGYIVGAKVEGDRLLLRNRLLVKKSVEGQELVEQTMREIAAGQLSTSTGDIQKRKIVWDDDKSTYTQYAIESVKNQTNAIVEHDMHASDAKIIGANFRTGSYDENGHFIATDGKEEEEKGDEVMTFAEYLAGLKTTLKAGGDGNVQTIVQELGIEVLTEEHKTQLSVLKGLNEKVGGDANAFIETVLKERQDTFASLRDAELAKEFTVKEVLGIAKDMFSLKEGGMTEIQTEVARLKGLDSIKNMQTFLASQVSFTPAGEGVDVKKETVKNTKAVEA